MEAIDGQTHHINAETFLFTPARGRVEHWPLVHIQAAIASDITVTSNPDPAQLQSLGVTGWPIWACDLVVFDSWLSCTWEVHAPVCKHYRFS